MPKLIKLGDKSCKRVDPKKEDHTLGGPLIQKVDPHLLGVTELNHVLAGSLIILTYITWGQILQEKWIPHFKVH